MAVQRVISTTPDIQREETDSASASGVHGSVQVAQAATVDSVRSAVGGASPGDIPGFLAARVQELKGLGISAEVEKPEDLIPVLAADMKRKNAALSPDQQENLSDEQWSEAAKGQIEGNKTTALTTSDDRYTAIKGGASFDELHEFIHICSAPGGASALMQFNLNMNEGAINYFSELTAAALGTAVIARYPEATVLVTKLVNMIGANGPALLYSATFKGDVNGFFNAVGDVFSKSGDKRPNGTSKFASEKGWTAASAADEFKSKVRAWNLKWLEQRV